MKKLKLSEDLVPLSRRQHTVLTLIIACVFQFLFFFAPALAAEAVIPEQNAIQMDATSKGAADPTVSALIEQAQAQNSQPLVAPINEAPTVKVVRTSTHTLTAYNSDPAQTDDSPCITANGFNVCEHGEEDTIAANFLKFGTKVRIPELYGDKIFTVRDRMNQRYNNRIDVWMKDRTDAVKFGVKVAKIEVVEYLD